MRKILSLMLAIIMLVSAIPAAYATTDVSNGTEVEYLGSKTTIDGEGNEVYAEAYTVTVPALLAPGESGNVVAEGTWPSNRKLIVSADEIVTLSHSINTSDKKDLEVGFDGIELIGSNTATVTNTKVVSIANIDNVLFGTWNGTFYYQVQLVNDDYIPVGQVAQFKVWDEACDWYNPEEVFSVDYEQGMTWRDFVNSEYNQDIYIESHGSRKFEIIEHYGEDTLFFGPDSQISYPDSQVVGPDDYISNTTYRWAHSE